MVYRKYVSVFIFGTGNLLGSGALDVLLNPLMGFISDSFYKTKPGQRFGRRRFFILIGIPLMCLYPLLWVEI